MNNAFVSVTESTFTRQVLSARLPVVVCFAAPWCDVCAALGSLLQRLAVEYAGRVIVATVNGDEETLLAEQYNVTAVPTLLVFHDGEERTRLIGFVHEGLLKQFFAEAATATLPRQWLWSPTEQAFEDAVLLPLLTLWGFHYARQVRCAVEGEGRTTTGRADVVVYGADERVLTLFENKRLIATQYDLQQAMHQGRGYAQALGLPSFAVAAPSGVWLFLCKGKRATLVQQFSALDLFARPGAIKLMLLELGQ